MDQYLATVIVAIITGLFSVATIIIQKRQEKVITRIDEQTAFMDKEQDIRKRLTSKEKEREQLMYEVMILVLDTNLHILKNTEIVTGDTPDEAVYSQCKELKKKFNEVTEDIGKLSKEYDLIVEMSAKFRDELNQRLADSKKKK